MMRVRGAAAVFASLGLVAAMATPALAEPAPTTLSIVTSVSHYLGGDWEHSIRFNVSCEGFETQEVQVGLPGSSGDVLPQIGPVPVGTACSIDVSYWPDPGDQAGWNDPGYQPDSELTIHEGSNVVELTLPRVWAAEWPPAADTAWEHAMALSVDRVYLNGKGGIEVEGTSWCAASQILTGAFEGDLYAGVQWMALQYVGRKTAITGAYASGIAHPCWLGSDGDHGAFRWQTLYAYPNGSLQWVYASNGKFGSGTIHIEADSQTGATLVSENFTPGGWLSFEGDYVPYAANCEDSNGDGWCVAQHDWYGWAQADLRPIRVK